MLIRLLRHGAAALLLFAAPVAVAPALAEKPLNPIERPTPTTITAVPIDFDRNNSGRKEFGKLVFRAGLNLYARSAHFGGFSALAIDESGRSLLAISDAGSWLRATLDYDGRKLKGLDDAVLGPILGADGKPLRDDRQRDSEGMTLAEGDTKKGTAYLSFERRHRIARYPFNTQRFGPPAGPIPLPAGTKGLSANRGIEAMTVIRAGRLKGTLVAFAEGTRQRRRKSPRLAHRRSVAGTHHAETPRRLRCHRCRFAARRKHRRAGAAVSLQRRRQDADPPHRGR